MTTIVPRETTKIKQIKDNPLYWGKAYLAEHFRHPSPNFHLIILREAMKNKYLAIQAPRGSAKTTILQFLLSTHGICLKLYRHIIFLQNTWDKATGNLLSIKTEIKNNPLLIEKYKIKIVKDAAGEAIFEHPDGFRTRVLCKGLEQIGSIRGEKFGAYRPDLVLGDDIEDDKMVKNPELRNELKENIDNVVLKCGEPHLTKFIIVGTPLHDDSLMTDLISPTQYRQFHKLRFMARWKNTVTGEITSLWPEKWSVADLNAMERENAVSFAQEMQCDPVSGSRAKFAKEDFRNWYVENDHYVLIGENGQILSKGELRSCKAAIACDLAWEIKKESDFSAIMPGLLTPNSELLIDTYVCEKGMRPDQLEEHLFTMEEKYRKMTKKPVPIGFEKAKLEKVMKFYLKQAMQRRNHYLTFKDLLWVTDKIERIVTALQPRYKQNSVFHKSGMGDLEHQLMRVPSGKHDDLCFGYGTKIATIRGDVEIQDINIGDKVITPIGLCEVTNCGFTGFSETIEFKGMNITPKHKVFINENPYLASADTLWYNAPIYKLSIKEQMKWTYQRLLYSMGSNTEEWAGRESIICLNRIKIKDESLLKDFMLRFMNIIGKFQFRKAFMFTTLTATHLTTRLTILCVYQLANTIKCLKTMIKKYWLIILRKLKKQRRNGMDQKKALNGIGNTAEMFLATDQFWIKDAAYATKNSKQEMFMQEHVHKPVETEKSTSLEMVFNMTVKDAGVYYANGVLVSNCDCAQGLVQLLQYAPKKGKIVSNNEDDMFDWLVKRHQKKHHPAKKAFTFGNKNNKPWGIPAIDTWR